MLKKMMEYFDSQADLRERALGASRAAIRASARAIAAIHRGERKEADEFLSEAKKGLDALAKVVESEPDMASSGHVLSAQQEYGEAIVVKGIINEGKLIPLNQRRNLSARTGFTDKTMAHHFPAFEVRGPPLK